MNKTIKTEHRVSYPVETTGTTGGRCVLVWDDATETTIKVELCTCPIVLNGAVVIPDVDLVQILLAKGYKVTK
jgi:hypothetical protein